jgi:hypothetical protein
MASAAAANTAVHVNPALRIVSIELWPGKSTAPVTKAGFRAGSSSPVFWIPCIANICYVPKSIPRIAGLLLRRYERTIGCDDVTTEAWASLYDEMTGRAVAARLREGLSAVR